MWKWIDRLERFFPRQKGMPDAIYETRAATALIRCVGVLSGGLAVASIILAAFYPKTPWLKATLGLMWGLGPPTWFFLEAVYIFPAFGNPQADAKRFHEIQSLAAKFWVGVGATLAVIYKLFG